MNKRESMGLSKFQWFKLNKCHSKAKNQYSNHKKPKELLYHNNIYNYKILKSLDHLLLLRHTASDMDEEKLKHRLYLINLLNKESVICDGNNSLLKVNRIAEDKVDASLRDEAVKNLKVMNKVYFELPISIFCSAVQLIDRFITKVKVKPKYMYCASAVCYQIIVKRYDPRLMNSSIMTDLPTISRSGGTINDLIRMEDIIRTKLYNELDTITVFDFVTSIINYLLINHEYALAISKLMQPIIETSITYYISGHQKPSILALACLVVYNNWYPQQPICSPWSLMHLSVLLKADVSTVYEYADLISEILNRFNQGDSRKQSNSALYHRNSSSLSKSIKFKLDTIIEE